MTNHRLQDVITRAIEITTDALAQIPECKVGDEGIIMFQGNKFLALDKDHDENRLFLHFLSSAKGLCRRPNIYIGPTQYIVSSDMFRGLFDEFENTENPDAFDEMIESAINDFKDRVVACMKRLFGEIKARSQKQPLMVI